jgi:hypothetical protein
MSMPSGEPHRLFLQSWQHCLRAAQNPDSPPALDVEGVAELAPGMLLVEGAAAPPGIAGTVWARTTETFAAAKTMTSPHFRRLVFMLFLHGPGRAPVSQSALRPAWAAAHVRLSNLSLSNFAV